jgi:pimeloyl-ACP methyl ester carboxylesterase
VPLCDIERVLIVGGAADAITPPSTLKMLVEAWPGAQYAEVPQGHFGYAAMGEALRQIDRFL